MTPSVVKKVGDFLKESASYTFSTGIAQTGLKSTYGFLEDQS